MEKWLGSTLIVANQANQSLSWSYPSSFFRDLNFHPSCKNHCLIELDLFLKMIVSTNISGHSSELADTGRKGRIKKNKTVVIWHLIFINLLFIFWNKSKEGIEILLYAAVYVSCIDIYMYTPLFFTNLKSGRFGELLQFEPKKRFIWFHQVPRLAGLGPPRYSPKAHQKRVGDKEKCGLRNSSWNQIPLRHL